MKEQFVNLLHTLAESPILFGFVAAVARWLLGDRAGGWWMFAGYLASALFVSWGVSLYIADEPYTDSKKGFYILLFSFAARDLLTAILALGKEFSEDPVGLLSRLKSALKGQKEDKNG